MDKLEAKSKFSKYIRKRERTGAGLRATEIGLMVNALGLGMSTSEAKAIVAEMVEAGTVRCGTRYGDYCWLIPGTSTLPEGAREVDFEDWI